MNMMKAIVLTVLIAAVMMSSVHGAESAKNAKSAKTEKNAVNAEIKTEKQLVKNTVKDTMHAEAEAKIKTFKNTMSQRAAGGGLRGKSGNKDTGFLHAKVSQPYPRACPCRRTSSGVAGPRRCVSPSV